MRLKLLAIGIAAVLLCAMVPMAVSAAPTTQVPAPQKPQLPIVGFVHLWNYSFNQGPLVGVMVIQSNGHFVCSCSGLKPNGDYVVGAGIVTAHSWEVLGVDPYRANAFGFLTATGTFSPGTMKDINYYLAHGGELVVWPPPRA